MDFASVLEVAFVVLFVGALLAILVWTVVDSKPRPQERPRGPAALDEAMRGWRPRLVWSWPPPLTPYGLPDRVWQRMRARARLRDRAERAFRRRLRHRDQAEMWTPHLHDLVPGEEDVETPGSRPRRPRHHT